MISVHPTGNITKNGVEFVIIPPAIGDQFPNFCLTFLFFWIAISVVFRMEECDHSPCSSEDSLQWLVLWSCPQSMPPSLCPNAFRIAERTCRHQSRVVWAMQWWVMVDQHTLCHFWEHMSAVLGGPSLRSGERHSAAAALHTAGWNDPDLPPWDLCSWIKSIRAPVSVSVQMAFTLCESLVDMQEIVWAINKIWRRAAMWERVRESLGDRQFCASMTMWEIW